MPELPEVETVRRDLEAVLEGGEIERIELLCGKLEPLATDLSGQRIERVSRFGKYLFMELEPSGIIVMNHLRMTGQWILKDADGVRASGHPAAIDLQNLPNKHTRAIIALKSGAQGYFQDQRLFGELTIMTPEQQQALRARLGIEPLTDGFTQEEFIARVKSRKSSIKAVLLNQEVVMGLGNIYVDEALYQTRIHPLTPANEISKQQLQQLYAVIEPMLAEAIDLGGTSIRDFQNGYGVPGLYKEKLQVYGRGGLPCYRCSTELRKEKIAGRGTVYCPKCQRAPKKLSR